MAPVTDGRCRVEGSGDTLRIRANILTPEGVLQGGDVVILNGLIACAACDCTADYPEATVLECPDALVTPGLVNPHDHLTFSQHPPVSPGDERYEHRHDWRKGKGGHTKLSVAQNFFSQGELWGELRMLLGGATSIMGSGGEEGFLRNLDRTNLLEGLTHGIPEAPTFPLGDSDGKLVQAGCGDYKKIPNPDTRAEKVAYVPHVAEGINDYARNEFLCMSGSVEGSQDLLMESSAFIHGIGLTTADAGLMATEGTGLIWSPRSNVSLYGFTAQVRMYDELGVRIALGTDWPASGSINVLRELGCAESLNKHYFDNYFSERDLIDMATQTAAELSGFGDVIGSIQVGRWADIAVFDGSTNEGYRALLDAGVGEVILVLRGGLVQTGDVALVDRLAPDDQCDVLDVCGHAKAVCTKRETGFTLAELQQGVAENGDQKFETYPLFFCDVPPDEPSCVPYRSGEFSGEVADSDPDGDGYPTENDNCPHVFNPPRPMDGGGQPNADTDDLGDACDPCPFDANTVDCSSVDPDDLDGDGVPNVQDNCPSVQNPDQANQDGDSRGDLCDDCPDEVDPCQSTVYEIKQGIVVVGETVSLPPVMVTAVTSNAFYVQHSPDEEEYPGPQLSALYVYSGETDAALVKRGDQVRLQGTVDSFYGKLELTKVTITQEPVTMAMPAPVVLEDPATIATGGVDATAYEAVLVEVSNVSVIDTAPVTDEPPPTHEFTVTGNLLVDDYLHLIDPAPLQGEVFERLTGILHFGWNNTKVAPRDAMDLVMGAPVLQSLTPDLVYLNEGVSGSTLPPLTVSLTRAAVEPTSITVVSADPTIVQPVEETIVIPTGAQTADVALSGLVGSETPVSVSVSYLDTTLSANVRVIGLSEVNTIIGTQPDELTLTMGSTGKLTVTTSLPAPLEGLPLSIAVEPVDSLSVTEPVVIPAGSTSVDVELTALVDNGTATVSVGLTPETMAVAATVTMIAKPQVGLILMELFYDPKGADDGLEWVKLYNGTGAPIPLEAYSIGWGGENYTYGLVNLSGTIASGACFVVGGPFTTEANGMPTFDQAFNFNPDIQNSGVTADGVALFATSSSSVTVSSVPIDAVVYGTENKNLLLDESGSAGDLDASKAASGSSLLRVGVAEWASNPTPNAVACAVF